MATYNVLMMGASYGSLLATKLLFGGHKITMVCLPAEVEAFNSEGARIRLPIRGRKEPIELDSRKLPGRLTAAGPGAVDPADYDLVVLAMQEPQYRSPGVRELLDAVARRRVPCMSIMNMPPLAYLKRIPGLATDAPTAILRQMQAEVDAIRYDPGDGPIDLPVKLKVHDSIFVPLAKWAMLLTGNYRCVTPDRAIDIKDAVHNDLAASRSVYDWVCGLCERLGAAPDDLVPFDKYAAAALDLVRPSSAARALFAGAPNIERADRLVQAIAAQYGMHNAVVDQTVATVDQRIAANRKAAA